MKEIFKKRYCRPQTMDGGLFVKGETGLKVGFGDTPIWCVKGFRNRY